MSKADVRVTFTPHRAEGTVNLYRPAIYISGPMGGIPEKNHPLFNACALDLRHQGWKVINPAEHFDGATDLPYHVFLAVDVIQLITYARAITLLDSWLESPGARLEAQIGVDLCYDFFSWDPHGGLQILRRQDIKEQLSGV